ncbi:MAG: DUF493 domain-containing protein, partial [Bacteroidia bacterium]|nr:DUF493 domain-containing protein [Bacteroidia bacterium]
MNKEEEREFYDRLRKELADSTSWPSDYLFKFIVTTDNEKIQTIHKIFDNSGAVIESRQSRKGKYTSISVTINLADPEAVIKYYKQVSRIEGVIS